MLEALTNNYDTHHACNVKHIIIRLARHQALFEAWNHLEQRKEDLVFLPLPAKTR